MADELTEGVREAAMTLRNHGHDLDELFTEHPIVWTHLSSEEAHAAGFLEGAGTALGLTALELLDRLDL